MSGGIGGGAVGLAGAVVAALAYGSGSVAQAAGLRSRSTVIRPAAGSPLGPPAGSAPGFPAGPPLGSPVGSPVGSAVAAPGAGMEGGAVAGVRRMARSPLYLVGFALDGLGFAASLVALRRLPVFAVQSILAASLGVTVVLAWLILKASLRRVDVVAVLVAALASAVTASAASAGPAAAPARGVVIALAVAAGGLLAAGLLLARRSPPSWLLALVSGLAFSVQALAARGLSLTGVSVHRPLSALGLLVSQPLVWSLAVAGATGIFLYASALERGGVAAATAVVWVVEIVVPTICGLLLLGDTVRPGWGVALVGSLLAAMAAAVVLARSPAQL